MGNADDRGGKRTAVCLVLIVVTGCLVAVGIAAFMAHRKKVAREAQIAANEYKVVNRCFMMYHFAQSGIRSGAEPAGLKGLLDRYASPYTLLYDRLNDGGAPFRLISREFRDARGTSGVPVAGYLFRDVETTAGKPIDWFSGYALCAIPAQHGGTGYRTFVTILRGDGIETWAKDRGPHAGFASDFPADPKAEGWVEVDVE